MKYEVHFIFYLIFLVLSRCWPSHHTSWKSYDNISLRVYLHPGPGVTPCHETLKSQNNWVAGDNKIFYYILTTNKGRWKSRKIRNLGETRDISRVDGVCRIFFPVTADLIFHAIIVVTAAFWTAQRVKRCCSQPGRGGCQTESAAIRPSTQLSLAHSTTLHIYWQRSIFAVIFLAVSKIYRYMDYLNVIQWHTFIFLNS